jgi:cytochrome c peroxidase
VLLKTLQGAMFCALAVLLAGCPQSSKTTLDDTNPEIVSDFNWNKPERIPQPVQPEDNIATEAKFQLGRHLFYDARLSGNGTMSCASCHQQDKAFTDGVALPVGSTGTTLARNSQALVNTAYNSTYTWANPVLLTLERQLLVPLFSDNPIEHGLNEASLPAVLAELQTDEIYQQLFSEAYPELVIGDFDQREIVHAIAVFVRGLNSFNSDFDRYLTGDSTALSDAAKRGRELFNGERFECFHCHGGYNFSDSTTDITQTTRLLPFHNTGLFNIGGTGDYPSDNLGILELTGNPNDMGKFRAPTLRNIELTAPYMHDGSVATLEQVLRNYAAGGRVIETGPNAGDGRYNPFKDALITGFDASDAEINDVVAFLHSLTDEAFITNPRFANPFASSVASP